jgi:translation elongation factor EF-G
MKRYSLRYVSGHSKKDLLDRNIKQVMENETDIRKFKSFCTKEYSTENILFIEKVDEFRKMKRHGSIEMNKIIEKYREIVDEFIKEESKSQLNINIETRDFFMGKLNSKKISHDIFDSLYKEIYITLENDLFNRYKKKIELELRGKKNNSIRNLIIELRNYFNL